ncbi:MAG: hypothetical protein D6776_08525 [Planctomycetota bacterium]|nr:MAG: hypothetical protein D6776_08525 [Planctomycetota bacterium]
MSRLWPIAASACRSAISSGSVARPRAARPSPSAPELTSSTSRPLRASAASASTTANRRASASEPSSWVSTRVPTFTTTRRAARSTDRSSSRSPMAPTAVPDRRRARKGGVLHWRPGSVPCRGEPATVYPRILGLPSWGLMIGLGTLTGYLLLARLARRDGHHRDLAIDLTWIVVLGGLVGSRALHVLEYWDVYRNLPPVEMLRIDRGGMSWYGMFATILPAAWWYARRHGLSLLEVFDLGTVYLPVAQAFGRTGCFLAGCCWGKPAEHTLWAPIAVRFPVGSPAWLEEAVHALGIEHGSVAQLRAQLGSLPPALREGSYALIPVQLLMAGFGAAVLAFYLLYHGRHRRLGQPFAAVFTLLALGRFGFEFLRADNPMVGEFTLHQWISLALAAAGALLWWALGRWAPPYEPRAAAARD